MNITWGSDPPARRLYLSEPSQCIKVVGQKSNQKTTASDRSVRATRPYGIMGHRRVLPDLQTSNHCGQKRFLLSALRTYSARSGTLSFGSALIRRRLLRSLFLVPVFDCAHGG